MSLIVSVVVRTPSGLCSTVSVTVSIIVSVTPGVHKPIVSVVQSTALLEEDRHTNIHSHSHK